MKLKRPDLLGEGRVVGEWGIDTHANVLRLFRSQQIAGLAL